VLFFGLTLEAEFLGVFSTFFTVTVGESGISICVAKLLIMFFVKFYTSKLDNFIKRRFLPGI